MRKIILTYLVVFIFSLLFIENSFSAYGVNPKIETVFDNFIIKLEKKVNKKNEIIFLEKLNKSIKSSLSGGSIESSKKSVLEDLLILSNEKIFNLKDGNALNNSAQILLENNILNNLKKKLDNYKKPAFYSKFNSIIHISNTNEFVQNNKIKKVSYVKYELVNTENYSYYIDKNGLFLLKENGEIHFIKNSNIQEKIPYSQGFQFTKNYIGTDKMYFEKNQDYYSYNFTNFINFSDKYGFYEEYFTKNGKLLSEQLLYLGEDKSYNFITDYTQVKLIHAGIIHGVTDKNIFLKHLVNDKLHIITDTDNLFIKLKSESKRNTEGKSLNEKIQIIYDWTLSSVKYTEKISIDDKRIFSGILSYKNNDGVCEGYVKLASYAMMFAGISDTEVIRGDVVDAQDFPQIGHAWLRIGDKYYDPTFDDPIGQEEKKNFSEYQYFGLPKDLLYANRFSYGETPDFLKKSSLDDRINFVNKRLSNLSDKYIGSDYLVLKGATFLKKGGLKVGEKITIEAAKRILIYGEVFEKKNGELILNKDGIEKNISKIQFYIVDESTINQIFEQLNYETDGIYLFKWNKLDGSTEYRVGFDIIIE